jgi:hypothetical protein
MPAKLQVAAVHFCGCSASQAYRGNCPQASSHGQDTVCIGHVVGGFRLNQPKINSGFGSTSRPRSPFQGVSYSLRQIKPDSQLDLTVQAHIQARTRFHIFALQEHCRCRASVQILPV